MSKIRVKKGDFVKVISGKDKGKEGKVLRNIPKEGKVVVEGVNMVTRHVKPSQKNPQAGIVKQEAPLYAAKVMLVCPACGKATRVGRAYLESGQKVRVCKECGEIVDKV
ncbi:MAG: 50S ribosomal protein L24 [Aminobacterium colombiense]|jgi:large subunit ribosomal protein L24|uniref:Large ribosomal subunit protein uL24 n=1 Tax=Aminobacterium colombiense (strain DSM 12261 / ALA-1) TaxID=572547 RepID=D5EDZ1_AMICL|nr:MULTISPECIES: 50S ribosomal protein L24 [Aminobacterium]MDD2378627.1 50S ribosomal protein L24 [Aminobacterium colombiense]ADE56773.1 ribosomal protein L24 [Aminobacterium colombiense DSM 12261]MDD3767646.1 50S ribosomal protein L24 [Aminobacterium colombiense]MDD4264930.1 50S ribosomal protein L24 [Aminobacterium colombiense]MDD4585507.1 50S ribosomal protein L24 [Aminobacterium colombiense]